MGLNEKLQGLIERVDACEKAVDLAVQSHFEKSTKRITFLTSESFIFRRNDFQRQERTYVNGAEDLYIDAIGVSPVTPVPSDLCDAESGIVDNLSARIFEFDWNARLASTGIWYCSSANGILMSNRKTLGNKERGIFHRFDYPYILKAGDALSIWMRPLIALPAAGGIDAIYINLFLLCHRTGQRAPSAYDLLAEARRLVK